jgi:hypothetical protein
MLFEAFADSDVTATDMTSQSTPEPTPTTPEQTQPEPVPTAPVNDPVPITPAAGDRRVSADTGEMEWLDSKAPQLEAASEWKYELDTVLSSNWWCYLLSALTRTPNNNLRWNVSGTFVQTFATEMNLWHLYESVPNSGIGTWARFVVKQMTAVSGSLFGFAV